MKIKKERIAGKLLNSLQEATLMNNDKLKRPASWMEAIIEYKGLDLRKKRDQELLKRISNFYEKYSKCKK